MESNKSNLVAIEDGHATALACLQSGGIVAVPTETVYGLAADATNSVAVERIFKSKGRPSFNPLIAHVSGIEMAAEIGNFNALALQLAGEFWPGPLTLVVGLKPDAGIAPAVTAGSTTIALRHPIGPMARLAGALRKPLAAPSANTSGRISPTTARHVADDLGNNVDIILDGGPCEVGLESTIVKVTGSGVIMLREGGVAVEEIEKSVGPVERNRSDANIEAPGMMLVHYAPNVPVRLNVDQVRENEALLVFGPLTARGCPHAMLNLSPMMDLAEAAHNLYAMLKDLDASGVRAIAVQQIPETGLGAAINDRLRRAAHGANKV